MPFDEGLSFLKFAREQELDSLLYQRWIAGPQYQISFKDFKAELTPTPPKPDGEIMTDVEKILTSFGGG